MTSRSAHPGRDRAARPDHRCRAWRRIGGGQSDRALFQGSSLCRVQGSARDPRSGVSCHPPRRREAGLGTRRFAWGRRDLPELLETLDGSPHGAPPPSADEPVAEAGIAPAWLLDRFDPAITPTSARPCSSARRSTCGSTGSKDRARMRSRRCPRPCRRRWSPIGLRLPEGFRVEQTAAWRHGLVEIQDEGSQLICLAARRLRTCSSSIFAPAPAARRWRLPRRWPIAAGSSPATPIATGSQIRRGCSVRRSASSKRGSSIPIAKPRCSPIWPARPISSWSTRPARAPAPGGAIPKRAGGSRRSGSTRLTALQARLLDVAAELVRPGGRLVYAVCSLLAEEGRDQAEALTRRSSLVPEPLPMPTGIAFRAGPSAQSRAGRHRRLFRRALAKAVLSLRQTELWSI